MMMEILTLGEKIKKRRKELNMTLKDLAGERITPGQISLVESGKSKPSMDLLSYLASYLQTPIEYLMESEETQAEKICTYYENISLFYLQNDNLLKADQYVENCIYYSDKYNLDYKKGVSYFLKGIIYLNRNKLNDAQEYFLTANSSFIKLGKIEDIIKSFLNLGRISIQIKSYHSALSYFQQTEKVYFEGKLTDPYLIGEIYYYLAFVYLKLENMEKSINYSYLAKEEFNKADDKKEYAKSLALISEQYAQNGEIEKAIKYSKMTNDIYKQIGDKEILSNFENDLGKLFFNLDNTDESFLHYYKAVEIRKETNDEKIIETYINLCENFISLKDEKSAADILEKIKNHIDEGSHKYIYNYYILNYKLNTIIGDNSKMEYNLLMALKYAEGENDYNKISEASIKLGKYYNDIGDNEKAVKYLNTGVDILKSIGLI
jgi:transcriptional regulator with XRE-family HTH domain